MRDAKYTDLILNGDIHTHNQKLAGLPERDDAKTFIYALLYGAGDAKIGTIIDGGAKAGRSLRYKFMSGLPAYAKLLEKIGTTMNKQGTLPGLDGRRLHVRSEHAALNTLLQSAGAVVMKKALVLAMDALQEAGIPCTLVAQVHDEVQVEAEPQYAEQVGQAFRKAIQEAGIPCTLVAQVHDEVQVEAEPQYAEQVGQAFRKAIQDAGTYYEMRCPLDGEYKVGPNWSHTH